MKRKLVLGILAVMLIAACFMVKTTHRAKTADFSVKVENQKVQKGNEITFYVTVNSSVNMSKIEAYMEYDSNYLEFVSAREAGVVGASGMLSIHEEFDTAKTSREYAITMRALEIGTTKISVKDIYLEDDTNSDIIEINQTSAQVTITSNANETSDASLYELKVFPGNLNEEFRPEITKYEVAVEHDVNELIVSAIPSTEESIVSIEGNEQLTLGENEVKILITAPSGTVKEYIILVTRASS